MSKSNVSSIQNIDTSCHHGCVIWPKVRVEHAKSTEPTRQQNILRGQGERKRGVQRKELSSKPVVAREAPGAGF